MSKGKNRQYPYIDKILKLTKTTESYCINHNSRIHIIIHFYVDIIKLSLFLQISSNYLSL